MLGACLRCNLNSFSWETMRREISANTPVGARGMDQSLSVTRRQRSFVHTPVAAHVNPWSSLERPPEYAFAEDIIR